MMEMYRRPPSVQMSEWDTHAIKLAAARAAPGVVSLVSHNFPGEMTVNFRGYCEMHPMSKKPTDIILFGSGIIIESSNTGHLYSSIVVAPASLFLHHHVVNKIDIDVFGSDGSSYKGLLLACDFHYNLAAVRIQSDSLLSTVTLKDIDETVSIDLPRDKAPFQLRPHSQSHSSFGIAPGTQIASVWRLHNRPYRLCPGSGSFSSNSPKGLSCNELYHINDSTFDARDGAPVLNSVGEVIGIIFNVSSFLPSNIVSRWWDHYKSSGTFHRPFIGIKVASLHEADLDFQALFMIRFPGVSTVVIVTKVEENSPACLSGIRTNDVIVKIDGKLVQSRLQFYERIWERVGKAVEINVLRVTDAEELNLSVVIEETSPNKFNKWRDPGWKKCYERRKRPPYAER